MKTFEEKVKSMTAREIILAMVEGLKNPTTEVAMGTFGTLENGICYGCAAANAICKIGGYTTKDLLGCKRLNVIDRVCLTGSGFVTDFEHAIDELRRGCVKDYNYYAKRSKFALIKRKPGLKLPHLTDEYTLEELEAYVELANY